MRQEVGVGVRAGAITLNSRARYKGDEHEVEEYRILSASLPAGFIPFLWFRLITTRLMLLQPCMQLKLVLKCRHKVHIKSIQGGQDHRPVSGKHSSL